MDRRVLLAINAEACQELDGMCLIIIYKSGQSLVVWGITEGRQAARELDTFFLHVIQASDWSI